MTDNNNKKVWNTYEEHLLEKIIERDTKILELEEKIRVLEQNHFSKTKRSLEKEQISDVDCFNCKTTISSIRAKSIWKGRPLCIDCLHAVGVELDYGLRGETRRVLDYNN